MINLKRVIRDIPFIALLIAIVLVPFLGYKTGEKIKTPPFGYVCEDTTEDGRRICLELDEAGFIKCGSDADLEKEIMAAHLDCGVVIDNDISQKLAADDTAGCVKVITSPETLLPELCRIQTVSALSVVYSPYVTYDALKEAVDEASVKKVYYDMIDSGPLFEFEISSVDGSAFSDNSRSVNLFTGCLAILVFITSLIGIGRSAKLHYNSIKYRLGGASAWLHVFLPEFLIRVFFMLIAGTISCLVSGMSAMIVSFLIYAVIASLAGLLICMLLPDTLVIIITVFTAILSLGLCPVFTDLSLLVPIIGTMRYILIPYYLWII